jgi:hypothetical protein
LACKRVDMTKNYINRSCVHWRIRRRQSCGTTLYGIRDSMEGHKGGERHWSGSTTIYKSASGSTIIHRGVGNSISTMKSDGDQKVWVESCSKEILDRATLMEKCIKILDPERSMWTQMK